MIDFWVLWPAVILMYYEEQLPPLLMLELAVLLKIQDEQGIFASLLATLMSLSLTLPASPE